jgi:threonine synthase
VSGSRLVCAGCGWQAPVGLAHPFRCGHSGIGDVDHVLAHLPGAGFMPDRGADPNPFVRYRECLWAWQAAQQRGMADDAFVARVRQLDEAVAEVDGHGFRVTPYRRAEALGRRLGLDLWVKDETGNVAGSHKARHLMGVLLYLDVVEGGASADPSQRAPLAIASCGNAALAAAVLARAARRALQVFVPPDAEAGVLARLRELGAQVRVCPREPGERGDPCLRHFTRAVAAGALPFCCQGNQNGLAIDGGETLLREMLDADAPPLDHLVLQVGGGALASACLQAMAREVSSGRLARPPRVHTVQSQGAWPLKRAWMRLQQRLAEGDNPGQALRHAAGHRSQFMWPWETPPHSIATGILDDETYDWLAVLRGMASTGGSAVVADEDTLAQAHDQAQNLAGVAASATGSAGLAGVLQLQREGLIQPGARVGVLLTGVRRQRR